MRPSTGSQKPALPEHTNIDCDNQGEGVLRPDVAAYIRPSYFLPLEENSWVSNLPCTRVVLLMEKCNPVSCGLIGDCVFNSWQCVSCAVDIRLKKLDECYLSIFYFQSDRCQSFAVTTDRKEAWKRLRSNENLIAQVSGLRFCGCLLGKFK